MLDAGRGLSQSGEGGCANKRDLKAEVIRTRMACDSQVTLTMLPETWVHPWLLMSKISLQWPYPTGPGPKTFPRMNQQERMLQPQVSGGGRNRAPPLGTMRQLWTRIPGMHGPPPSAQPPLMLSQEQHGRLRLLPVTHQAWLPRAKNTLEPNE